MTTTLEPDTRKKTAVSEEEIEEFLSLMDLEPEPPCEYGHTVTICTVKVAFRVSTQCKGTSINVCQGARDFMLEKIAKGGTCIDCKRKIPQCWTIRAI